MCNCGKLREIVLDLDSNWVGQAVTCQGREVFSGFFEGIESESFEPSLGCSELYYCCQSCGQSWYIECAPDEMTFPLFGIKLQSNEHRLSENEIFAKKKFITILAHNGFDSEKCRHLGCDNYKLNGKQLCHNHLSIV